MLYVKCTLRPSGVLRVRGCPTGAPHPQHLGRRSEAQDVEEANRFKNQRSPTYAALQAQLFLAMLSLERYLGSPFFHAAWKAELLTSLSLGYGTSSR